MWPKFSTTALLFIGICLFRLLNSFLIQSFFDPDEYWQTLEPAYCEVFLRPQQLSDFSALNLECKGYTWEWRRRAKDDDTTRISWLEQSLHGPIRSYLSVLPTHLFYVLLKRFEWDSHFWVSQGPKLLTAVVAAAPTDLAVWIMAHWWPSPSQKAQSITPNAAWFCLFCSMVSWFHGYALVRTFSNSLETMLLSVSMALVAPELIGNQMDANGKTLRQCLCFLLGGCCVAMRFSSVTAWVPMGILLALHQRHDSMGAALVFLVRVCAVFGLAGIGLACVVDRCFYGFWAIPFLGSFHFNVMLGNAALYGSHPWHWYLTAGIPAITGLWLPFVAWDLKLLLVNISNKDDSLHCARWNVWIIMGVCTLAHSIAGHKEFRFLLPILPLFCLQAGIHVKSFTIWLSQKRKTGSAAEATTHPTLADVLPWLTLMSIPNLIALLYLGLFHQSAPISVNHKIAALAAAKTQSHNKMITPTTYSVHYLTGACHSTPLHSYLHNRANILFDTWSLDCSPECRSDPEVLCESERFATDPVGFVEEAYFSSFGDEGECSNDDKTCTAADSQEISRQPPTYLVTYSDYAWKVQSQLSSLGLQEVGRFSHGINGIRIGNLLKTGDGYLGHGGMSDKELGIMYRRVSLLGDLLELSIDEMVLFS